MTNRIFANYCRTNFISLRHAEKVLGIGYQSIHAYIRGEYAPTYRRIMKIERNTKGAVPAKSWTKIRPSRAFA